MIWNKANIKNKKQDLTKYTDIQLDYLVEILNKIEFPWVCFEKGNVKIEKSNGAFGDVYTLLIDGICYMTNSAPDLIDHRSIFEQAHGDILLTGYGLGLGVLLSEINEKIDNVTIIENNPLIIEHIAPMVNRVCKRIKSNIIIDDANFWVPNKTFDFAFIDHAYERAEDTHFLPYCETVISWWDVRQELEKTWR